MDILEMVPGFYRTFADLPFGKAAILKFANPSGSFVDGILVLRKEGSGPPEFYRAESISFWMHEIQEMLDALLLWDLLHGEEGSGPDEEGLCLAPLQEGQNVGTDDAGVGSLRDREPPYVSHSSPHWELLPLSEFVAPSDGFFGDSDALHLEAAAGEEEGVAALADPQVQGLLLGDRCEVGLKLLVRLKPSDALLSPIELIPSPALPAHAPLPLFDPNFWKKSATTL